MRYTTRYNIPVPEGADSADIPTTVGATADAVDSRLYQVVGDATNAAAAAATTALADTVAARNAAQGSAAAAATAADAAVVDFTFMFLGA